MTRPPAPESCRYCSSGNATYNHGYRDAVTYDCGAKVSWHDPPHGTGWSWWTHPESCKIISALKSELETVNANFGMLTNAVEQHMLQHHVEEDHHGEPTVWRHLEFIADNALEYALSTVRPGVWTATPQGLAFTGLRRDVYGPLSSRQCPLCREGERLVEQPSDLDVLYSCGSSWSERRRTDAWPENWDRRCKKKGTR